MLSLTECALTTPSFSFHDTAGGQCPAGPVRQALARCPKAQLQQPTPLELQPPQDHFQQPPPSLLQHASQPTHNNHPHHHHHQQQQHSMAKAQFVDTLVDTAAIVIESIWPPPMPSQSPNDLSQHNKKSLPLRTFIQETLKRSRSSYSTLQTALYYLYKVRNNVPSVFLKRRKERLYLNQQTKLMSVTAAAGLATPPPSPLQTQLDSSNVVATDYFSHQVTAATVTAEAAVAAAAAAAAAALVSPPQESSDVTMSAACEESLSPAPTTSCSNSNRIVHCGRRTFLAALMVASKYLQDRNYSNKAWAKISGLSIQEINANELVFLKLIDYSLFVSHDTFIRWTALLVAHGKEATRQFMHSADSRSVAAMAVRSLLHQGGSGSGSRAGEASLSSSIPSVNSNSKSSILSSITSNSGGGDRATNGTSVICQRKNDKIVKKLVKKRKAMMSKE